MPNGLKLSNSLHGVFTIGRAHLFLSLSRLLFLRPTSRHMSPTMRLLALINGLMPLHLRVLQLRFISPIFGAIADHGGQHKFWLFVFTFFSVIFTALFWFTYPTALSVPLALT